MPSAAYANAENTDVALTRNDGTIVAVKPGDARLEGLSIAAFTTPPPPPPRTIEQLMADLAALQAEFQALAAG